jgi:hypothetical protein
MDSMLVQVGRRSSGAQLGTGGSSIALDHTKMHLHAWCEPDSIEWVK